MIEITLTGREIVQGAFVGIMRQVECIARQSKNQHGAKRDWQIHIEGALGEMAFSKAVGVYWSAITKFGGRDAGAYEVRTRSKHHYELIVRDSDADNVDVRFVLVTGSNGSYVIRGWIRGRDAMRDEWRKGHGGREPAWFVPQCELCDEFGVTG